MTAKNTVEYCQFCDKEMRIMQSVVSYYGYTTCGAGKCLKKAAKAALSYVAEQHEKLKRASSIIDFLAIFRTKTPEEGNSWEPCLVDDHPGFMKDMDDCLKALELGVVQDDEDEGDWWYFVIPTDDIVDAVQTMGIPANIQAPANG